MASPAPLPDPASAAFNKAIREFRVSLKNEALYNEILATTSADQVYDLTDKLQNDQSKGGHLRNLAKLKPYIDRLQGYCGAIDTFVQAKPEILALIWGPIKLLIQWASTMTSSLDALTNTARDIARLLPEFSISARMFGLNELLALFFQDMLDFYLVMLQFLSMPKTKSIFEALWPRKKDKINDVSNRIMRHTTMLRNDVRFENMQEEYNHRARSMEHFETVERTTRRTEYGVFEQSVSPTFYDTKLYNLRGDLCEGTGDWLLGDVHMRQWFGATGGSPKVIWLRGIPGAGKTFLAASVVDKLSKTPSSRVVFAFLNHALKDRTTALSVIHSLIFQLTRDDSRRTQDDNPLQDVLLWEISRGDLCSDLTAATDVLIKLLACAGRVHIVVDGLDEVDEKERGRLLQEMLRISETSDEARVLVSCRAEYDLKPLLQTKSTEIRVNARNMDGIQAYVTSYYSQWSQSRDLDQEEKNEFVELFSPIASCAKGMFMYARLVLKNLDFLTTIDEVRDELRVLPKDLDDAYGRIFSRVNEISSDTVRGKIRRILGWVGCSPIPITIQELEQALSICIGDYNQVPGRYSTLPLVRWCGPVVEVVDDEVHFVHFTAKQYFFCHEVGSSLDVTQYTLSLAKTCITYLCQSHHDPDIDESQLETHMLNGVYRLHHYATGAWIQLLVLYCQTKKTDKASPEWSQLLDLLHRVLDRRVNADYTPDNVEANFPSLKSLKNKYPKVYTLLCREAHFHQQSESTMFKLGTDDWNTSDPTTLHHITTSLHRALDKMADVPAEPEDHTQHVNHPHLHAIRRNYGTRPFKCPFVGCSYHRIGFETKALRLAHCKNHDQRWRCEVPACEYAEVGFLSRRMRDYHLAQFHATKDPEPLDVHGSTSKDQQVDFMLSLIKADKAAMVHSRLVFIQDINNDQARALLEEVLSSGSYNMIEAVGIPLWDRVDMTRGLRDVPFYAEGLFIAVKAGNVAALKWMAAETLERAAKYRDSGATGEDLHKLLSQALVSILKSRQSAALSSHFQCIAIALSKYGNYFAWRWSMDHEIISATSGQIQSEGVLISLWRRMTGEAGITRQNLGTGLQSVAATTCSITLASALIDLGAELGHGRLSSSAAPLQLAAQKDTKEAASLIRFLLYRGANPETEYEKKYQSPFSPTADVVYIFKIKISEEVGTKGISRWLNKSWEELVAEAREARRKNSNPPIPED